MVSLTTWAAMEGCQRDRGASGDEFRQPNGSDRHAQDPWRATNRTASPLASSSSSASMTQPSYS